MLVLPLLVGPFKVEDDADLIPVKFVPAGGASFFDLVDLPLEEHLFQAIGVEQVLAGQQKPVIPYIFEADGAFGIFVLLFRLGRKLRLAEYKLVKRAKARDLNRFSQHHDSHRF